jgi:hypothetical protein
VQSPTGRRIYILYVAQHKCYSHLRPLILILDMSWSFLCSVVSGERYLLLHSEMVWVNRRNSRCSHCWRLTYFSVIFTVVIYEKVLDRNFNKIFLLLTHRFRFHWYFYVIIDVEIDITRPCALYESPHSFFVTGNWRNVLNDRYRYVTELTRLILRILSYDSLYLVWILNE